MGFTSSLEKMIQLALGSKDPVAISAVMDVQKELISIQEENRKLREENHELKNERILEVDLEFNSRLYVRKSDKRKFCPKCWDSDKKLISVLEADLGMYCPVCEMYY